MSLYLSILPDLAASYLFMAIKEELEQSHHPECLRRHRSGVSSSVQNVVVTA